MSSGDPSTFQKRLNRRAANIRENVEHLRREIAEEILIEVVLATPVDTGKARSNWRVGLGAPAGGTIPAYSPGRRLGLGESANANAAIVAGQGVLRESNPNSTIYISNSVSYMDDLNDGGSPQAAPGFIDRAFERARGRVYRTRRFLDSPGSR